MPAHNAPSIWNTPYPRIHFNFISEVFLLQANISFIKHVLGRRTMAPKVEEYTIGWICAVEVEFIAACEFLDEEYDKKDWPHIASDVNAYHFGRIDKHNVAIACLPKGRYGTTSAALVAHQMRNDFPGLRFGLMVGIGGGAPSVQNDIRLGDVVISSPLAGHSGVLHYDYGKALQGQGFQITGHLSPPPRALLNAIACISAQHRRKEHRLEAQIKAMIQRNSRLKTTYCRPPADTDRLCLPDYVHTDTASCDCDGGRKEKTASKNLQHRPKRSDNIVCHYGLIASANTLVKDAILRNALVEQHDVLCFEMEAAGLMNDFPCIVIRGICDYSDSHKNDRWQGYAAAASAAYAKELLCNLRATGGCPDRSSSAGSTWPPKKSKGRSATMPEHDWLSGSYKIGVTMDEDRGRAFSVRESRRRSESLDRCDRQHEQSRSRERYRSPIIVPVRPVTEEIYERCRSPDSRMDRGEDYYYTYRTPRSPSSTWNLEPRIEHDSIPSHDHFKTPPWRRSRNRRDYSSDRDYGRKPDEVPTRNLPVYPSSRNRPRNRRHYSPESYNRIHEEDAALRRGLRRFWNIFGDTRKTDDIGDSTNPSEVDTDSWRSYSPDRSRRRNPRQHASNKKEGFGILMQDLWLTFRAYDRYCGTKEDENRKR